MAEAWDTPLMQNPHVKELLTVLTAHDRDTSGLKALLGHVSEMENFIKRAEEKIADMKCQLNDMKEIQNHPVKNALQNTIKNLEQKVAEFKARIAGLKNSIIGGCKNAVAEFKAKGVGVLDKLASFFNIKAGLQALKTDIEITIKADDRAIAKINAFSNEYHKAGRALKNMARVAIGKKPIDTVKESGEFARGLTKPYRVHKAALTGIKKSIEKSIIKLEILENTVAVDKGFNQEKRIASKKPPSLLGQLEINKILVEQMKCDTPAIERPKAKETAI
jgi:hypothetical protein